MNMTIYQDAIQQVAIPKLTAFLKTQNDLVEIEGWAKMRAPEKRTNLIEALTQSKQLREQFVAFYGEETAKEVDFSEWEVAIAEDAEAPEAETVAEEATPAETAPDEIEDAEIVDEAPAPVAATPTTFVEGAFEQIIADVAGLDAQASKANLLEAEDRMEFEHIRIGALLSHIQSSEHYQTLGYDSLKEFMLAETGMQYRKGMYLIGNYETVKNLDIPAEKLKGVTWSALRCVTPIMNSANYDEWLDAARSTVQATLIEQVAAEKAKQAGALPAPETGGDDEPVKAITKNFNVTPDQNVTISAALDKAKAESNVESASAALEVISASYTGKPVSDTSIAAVHPDTSKEGFEKMFSKLAAEGGNGALIPVLEAIGEIWPDVDITVSFPTEEAA